MKALFDTNILIDYLNGIEATREEISRYDDPMISPISWMGVMVGTSAGEQDKGRFFLSRLHQVDIDAQVAEIAVAVRRSHRMRLPDAIIWASAQTRNALLISRNTKGFPVDEPGMRIPYCLRSRDIHIASLP